MKFKLIEEYTDYGYMSNGIEVASDASDEQPDDEKEQIRSYMPLYKTFIVTIQGKPQCEINAKDRKEAALKCRKQFKDKINILGIKEI